jgi:hypothetical protein
MPKNYVWRYEFNLLERAYFVIPVYDGNGEGDLLYHKNA